MVSVEVAWKILECFSLVSLLWAVVNSVMK
jgi:hypothetical protein